MPVTLQKACWHLFYMVRMVFVLAKLGTVPETPHMRPPACVLRGPWDPLQQQLRACFIPSETLWVTDSSPFKRLWSSYWIVKQWEDWFCGNLFPLQCNKWWNSRAWRHMGSRGFLEESSNTTVSQGIRTSCCPIHTARGNNLWTIQLTKHAQFLHTYFFHSQKNFFIQQVMVNQENRVLEVNKKQSKTTA